MAGFGVWSKLVYIYSVSAFWGIVVSFQVLKFIVFKRSQFFAKKNRLTCPAVLQNKVFGVHKFAVIDHSIKLHYVESGSSDKPLMLFLHGFPEFWYSWRNQIKEFQKDYRVVAVDMRGYGESSKPSEVSKYSMTILASDVAKLIKFLSPGQKCYLVSHDWGGAIAWVVAGYYPHLLEKLIVLNCPHPAVLFTHLQNDRKQFLKSWYMFFINLPYYPEWYFSSGDIMFINSVFLGPHMKKGRQIFTVEDEEAYKYTYNKRSDFTGPMNYYRSYLRHPVKGLSKVRVNPSCPVLVIWGTEDRALGKEMAEMCRQYADDFTLKYVQGASHFVQQEEADVVNNYIREFITGSPGLSGKL